MDWKLERELQYLKSLLKGLHDSHEKGTSDDYHFTKPLRDFCVQRIYEIKLNSRAVRTPTPPSPQR